MILHSRIKQTIGFLGSNHLSALGGSSNMKHTFFLTPILFLVGTATPGTPAENKNNLSQIPPPSGFIAPDAKPTVAGVVCFFEGPAVDENGNVFFSDIISDR